MEAVYTVLKSLTPLQILCIIVTVLLLTVGAYYIVTEFLIIPDDKARRAVLNYGKGIGKISSEEMIALIA